MKKGLVWRDCLTGRIFSASSRPVRQLDREEIQRVVGNPPPTRGGPDRATAALRAMGLGVVDTSTFWEDRRKAGASRARIATAELFNTLRRVSPPPRRGRGGSVSGPSTGPGGIGVGRNYHGSHAAVSRGKPYPRDSHQIHRAPLAGRGVPFPTSSHIHKGGRVLACTRYSRPQSG
jgi:hypothetical protein